MKIKIGKKYIARYKENLPLEVIEIKHKAFRKDSFISKENSIYSEILNKNNLMDYDVNLWYKEDIICEYNSLLGILFGLKEEIGDE